ncbi:MAG: hypothetical protein LBG04_01370 [Holosporaceae bacterium]|jgi:hypothetical protein|nr:hypothetical protein [Holosporaceae bacterium]
MRVKNSFVRYCVCVVVSVFVESGYLSAMDRYVPGNFCLHVANRTTAIATLACTSSNVDILDSGATISEKKFNPGEGDYVSVSFKLDAPLQAVFDINSSDVRVLSLKVQDWVSYLHKYNTSLKIHGVTATWTTSANALIILANDESAISEEISVRKRRFDPMFKELESY